MNRFINALRPFSIALLFMGLSVSGCGAFSPRPDPSRFFTLSSLPQAEETAVNNSNNPERIFLGIGPIRFPGYLDRQEIVIRSGQNRFDVSESDRWAEPLDENFVRVLSQDLSALFHTDRVVPYPWPSGRKPDYQVEIEMLRFETNAARDAQLWARWELLDGSNKKSVHVRESRLTRPARERSTDASVAALSETVADLSREIADAVRAHHSESSRKGAGGRLLEEHQ